MQQLKLSTKKYPQETIVYREGDIEEDIRIE